MLVIPQGLLGALLSPLLAPLHLQIFLPLFRPSLLLSPGVLLGLILENPIAHPERKTEACFRFIPIRSCRVRVQDLDLDGGPSSEFATQGRQIDFFARDGCRTIRGGLYLTVYCYSALSPVRQADPDQVIPGLRRQPEGMVGSLAVLQLQRPFPLQDLIPLPHGLDVRLQILDLTVEIAMTERERADTSERPQAIWQIAGLRHFHAVNQDRDRPDILLERCFYLDMDPVLRLVNPPRSL
ncbi:MAG TPA: hypothetical protein VGS06_39960 [Streptosporangiaceae bacterium]|nr:hypothetical protein [Streptosporangiaceae bacterium]